jgi:hypothetical protein
VEIHVTDDRLGGYFRRYQLAIRLMSHGARTQTVIAWTDLTRDQLVTQRRRWGFGKEIRQRGPAPSAFHVFFKSRRHRSEAALFASICHIVGAITAQLENEPPRFRPCLENGELLCDALEAFREWAPNAELDFEHALQLAAGVVHAEHVTLGWCSDCRSATLFEGSRRVYANCGHCLPESAGTAQDCHPGPLPEGEGMELAREETDQPVVDDHERTAPERNPDHVPEREVGTGCGNLERDRDDDPDQHETGTDGLDERGQKREDR